MVEKLIGFWKLEHNENFDEFMKAAGVNYMLRKIGNTLTSYEEIRQDGDDWMVHVTSTFKSSKLNFRLDDPFPETTMDGRKVTTEFKIENNKLVCTHTPLAQNDVPCKYEREVLDDGRMLLTCNCIPKNVIGKRYFQPHTP